MEAPAFVAPNADAGDADRLVHACRGRVGRARLSTGGTNLVPQRFDDLPDGGAPCRHPVWHLAGDLRIGAVVSLLQFLLHRALLHLLGRATARVVRAWR